LEQEDLLAVDPCPAQQKLAVLPAPVITTG
jgi:hypothetical protein